VTRRREKSWNETRGDRAIKLTTVKKSKQRWDDATAGEAIKSIIIF
jgi:hypothetical protein